MNPSNQDDRKIVEDTPRYRSVMIAGPMSAPPMPRTFGGPNTFAKHSVTQKLAPRSQSVGTANWKVHNIPSLPAAYFLERSNVRVEGTPQEIANRISECLRKESIASFSSADDQSLLLAETSDCVKLAVRLFADNGKVIVEVQRKCGCSYQFRETARTVLRAAKGVASPPKRNALPLPPLPFATSGESNSEREQRAEAGLEVAMQQLCSERLDSQLIGMESLEQITRSGSLTCVSRKVLSGPCLEKVLIAAKEDSSNDDLSDIEEEHMCVMKRRAMAVVANALISLTESGDLITDILSSNSELKSESFITSLVDTLREFREAPHEATQAARCMTQLITDKQVGSILQDMRVASVASDACAFGAISSALLEQESKKLKLQLHGR